MMASVGEKLRIQVLKSSKLYGYSLNSEALKYLVEILIDLDPAEREQATEQIWNCLAKQKAGLGQITRDQCELAVLECTGQGKDGQANLLTVIDAFSIPRYVYDRERQKFIKSEAECFPEDSNHKADFYRNRYHCLHQRLLRNPIFTPRSAGAVDKSTHKFKLKPIEALYGATTLVEDISIFGMITEQKPGTWHLEDLTGSVQLDLAKAEFRPGLICDGCFVLCDGSYQNEIFTVVAVSLPPAEKVDVTRSQFGDINFFGGELSTCAASNTTLRAKEQENRDAFLVFLSSVHLDDTLILKKLDTLFLGYNDNPPVAIVLCGPFLSETFYHDPVNQLSGSSDLGILSSVQCLYLTPSINDCRLDCFKNLAKLISCYQTIKEKTQFIFVPAMEDLGSLSVCPRPRIPQSVTAPFSKLVKNAVFTTNPCRIQYCTKEIVVFRENLITKMFRRRVNNPREDLPNHFARTLVSLSSLCLLPLGAMPVCWMYDHAMSLYPLPSLVVVADNYMPYTEQHSGCHVINPGSFPLSKFSFKVFYPATGEIEDSEIPK